MYRSAENKLRQATKKPGERVNLSQASEFIPGL